MKLTTRSMEWLNQNRHRSFPLERDGWREIVSPESGLDCILLDALVFDSDASGSEELRLVSCSVGQDETSVTLKYINEFSVRLHGGEESGPGSYECVSLSTSGGGERAASISLSFSSHAYILKTIGVGNWNFDRKVIDTRVIRLSRGTGVDFIESNGSSGVEGHEDHSLSSGDIVLEDGYRTSPIIHRGRVLVRVGRSYGENPCHYDFGEGSVTDCRAPLFFFCGQNAINGGNVVIKGGAGISVAQGRSYTVRDGSCKGKDVPCIEIVAGRELLDLYRSDESEMV